MKPDERAPETDDHATGLPGLRTWRAVYWAVAGVFAVVVALLVALAENFT